MRETVEERKIRDRQEDLARLRGLWPIDDDFMRCIFRDNIPLAQLVLRIITGKEDLIITHLETQKDLKRLVGARSICVDALGTDNENKKYDMEIQRADSGAGVHLARYHASCMDVENLDAGQDFDELPETYTILITEAGTRMICIMNCSEKQHGITKKIRKELKQCAELLKK